MELSPGSVRDIPAGISGMGILRWMSDGTPWRRMDTRMERMRRSGGHGITGVWIRYGEWIRYEEWIRYGE